MWAKTKAPQDSDAQAQEEAAQEPTQEEVVAPWRYDLHCNTRVRPLGGRRPAHPGQPPPPCATLRIEGLTTAQQHAVAASLRAAGAELEVEVGAGGGGAVCATVSGTVLSALAAEWRTSPVTHQIGAEIAAAWQPLPGVIPLPRSAPPALPGVIPLPLPGPRPLGSAPPGAPLAYYERALVMGIINVTPDSFYPASRFNGRDAAAAAVEKALQMAEQGADVIDVGGESTRPGALPVAVDDEVKRVVPVVEEIVAGGGPPVSVDTSKADVAAAALDAGAVMINDVCGLRDQRLRELVCRARGGGGGDAHARHAAYDAAGELRLPTRWERCCSSSRRG